MSLKIRLSRGGAKKRPFYRIVVADARMPRDGRFVEKIGTFDPVKAKDDAMRLVLDVEKAKAWLAKGAQPTDRVLRLLDGLGVAKREAHNNPEKAQAEEEGAGAHRRRRRGRREGRRRRRSRSEATLLPSPARREKGLTRFLLSDPDRLIALGVFGAPQGVRGEVRVKSYTQDPKRSARYGAPDRSRRARGSFVLEPPAAVERRHARRARRGGDDARGRASADGRRTLRPARAIAAARRGRILLRRSRRARRR